MQQVIPLEEGLVSQLVNKPIQQLEDLEPISLVIINQPPPTLVLEHLANQAPTRELEELPLALH